jgi:hypothetical protein
VTENDPDTVIFNLMSSTVPKWWMFKFVRWLQNLHQTKWEHEGLRPVTMETICDS